MDPATSLRSAPDDAGSESQHPLPMSCCAQSQHPSRNTGHKNGRYRPRLACSALCHHVPPRLKTAGAGSCDVASRSAGLRCSETPTPLLVSCCAQSQHPSRNTDHNSKRYRPLLARSALCHHVQPRTKQQAMDPATSRRDALNDGVPKPRHPFRRHAARSRSIHHGTPTTRADGADRAMPVLLCVTTFRPGSKRQALDPATSRREALDYGVPKPQHPLPMSCCAQSQHPSLNVCRESGRDRLLGCVLLSLWPRSVSGETAGDGSCDFASLRAG